MPTYVLRKGFTLIELMVVVAIIAILASFAFPMLYRYRINAQRAQCVANMRQIHNAVESRRAAVGDGMPETVWGSVYVGSTAYFKTVPRCPNNGSEDYDISGATSASWSPQCKMTEEPYLHFFERR